MKLSIKHERALRYTFLGVLTFLILFGLITLIIILCAYYGIILNINHRLSIVIAFMSYVFMAMLTKNSLWIFTLLGDDFSE